MVGGVYRLWFVCSPFCSLLLTRESSSTFFVSSTRTLMESRRSSMPWPLSRVLVVVSPWPCARRLRSIFRDGRAFLMFWSLCSAGVVPESCRTMRLRSSLLWSALLSSSISPSGSWTDRRTLRPESTVRWSPTTSRPISVRIWTVWRRWGRRAIRDGDA